MEELITEAELEDVAALREAGSRFVARHCRVGRLLRDNARERLKEREAVGQRLKRREKPKHGPVRRWTPEEIEGWESGKDRVSAAYSDGKSIHYRYADGRRLYTPRTGYVGYIPSLCGGCYDQPGRINELSPDWSDRGRSGDRDGRNHSRITGSFKSERKTSKAKRIKRLTPTQLKRREAKYEEHLPKQSPDGVHLTYIDPKGEKGELTRKFDRLEWEELGHARKKPRATDLNAVRGGDDPAS